MKLSWKGMSEDNGMDKGKGKIKGESIVRRNVRERKKGKEE